MANKLSRLGRGLVLSLSVVCSSLAAQNPVEITLVDSVIRNVEDIENVSGLQPQELQQTFLGLRSELQAKWISKRTLSTALEQQLSRQVTINGPQKLWVSICQLVSENQLDKVFTSAMRKKYTEQQVRLKSVKVLNGLPCISGGIAGIDASEPGLRARQQIQLVAESGQVHNIWLAVEGEALLATAKQNVNASKEISELSWRYFPLGKFNPKDVFLFGSVPERLTTAKSLSKNSLLTTRNTLVPSVVNKGEKVTLLYQHGAVSIQGAGRALQSGNVGDTLSVLPSNSKKPVKVTVISKGVVRV